MPRWLEEGKLGFPPCFAWPSPSTPILRFSGPWFQTSSGTGKGRRKALEASRHKPWPETPLALPARVSVSSAAPTGLIHTQTLTELEGPAGMEAQEASTQVCTALSSWQTQDPSKLVPGHGSPKAQLSGQCSPPWAQPSTVCQCFLIHAHIQSSQHPKEASRADMVIPILQVSKPRLREGL